jgi:hypothetical protein
MIATQGLYAAIWLGLNWRELKRDVPELRWHPVTHGVTFSPFVFAMLSGIFAFVPFIAWPMLNATGLLRVREHFRVLASVSGQASAGSGLILTAAAGYLLSTWLALREVLFREQLEIGHFLGVMIAVVLGTFVVVSGQRLMNAHYDELTGVEVPYRSHPLEWIVVAVGGLLQIIGYTII